MRRERWYAAAALWALTTLLGPQAGVRAQASNPCEHSGTVIQVSTAEHLLRLCAKGEVAAAYPIALGVGGVGKSKQGDHKTPIGRYPIKRPRPSRSFGTFILVGYPTLDQRTAGLSGSDVGIHGPPRGFAPGLLSFDWTDGCIALASDAEIEAIAKWVRVSHARWVEID